ncbi:TetR family transcriptional regulator [Schaalia meyeri]|uniref:TetR family transcriptional regulator n=1 Tax=Schaalia meyeri TaxID=52773 RepID=UPI0006831BBE|nr:TetR/AcrR family transcriptional regulator C-terminal domain-containing protein [Schaalia meyeri]AKU65302.1 TetR family transcriptional regulator [Schaalia meyeri]
MPGGAPRTRTLTRGKILAAALTLVDEEGLPSLSLRALGKRLGVSQTAFYRHVPDKAALLEGVAEEVLRIAFDSFLARVEDGLADGDWRSFAREYAIALHTTLLAHPGTVILVLTHPVSTPGQFALLAKVMARLTEAGFEAPLDILAVISAVSVYTTGFAAAEVVPPVGGASGKPDDGLADAIATLPEGDLAALRGLIGDMMEGNWDFNAQFERGLDALLRGWR